VGRSQVAGPVLRSEFGRHLAENPNTGAHPRNGTAAIANAGQSSGRPVVQAPYILSSPGSLPKPQSLCHHRKSVAKEIRIESGNFGQGKNRTQLNNNQLPSPSILQQAAQLFQIKPIISGPGEEDLHFDLDPR